MQLAATLPARLRRFGRAVVDGVMPPRCLACGVTVDEIDALCGKCWSSITFFAPPWCTNCGAPFPHPMGDDAICAECARSRPSWDRARSVMRYDRHSRRMVLMLKHGDHTHLAGALGNWMHRAGSEVLAGAELFWGRVVSAGAAALDAALHPPLQPSGAARPGDPSGGRAAARIAWLVRRRRTPSQGTLGPAARARNVRGAFALRRGRSVKGRRIVWSTT
jgi:predicted amidophosphoribosyltransferase